MVVVAFFILCLPAAQKPDESEAPSLGPATLCPTTASVARTAQRICGAAPVEEALLSVRLQPGETTDAARRVLEGLGLRTAVDLRLLGGGPEATETMDALKSAGLSVGDRREARSGCWSATACTSVGSLAARRMQVDKQQAGRTQDPNLGSVSSPPRTSCSRCHHT